MKSLFPQLTRISLNDWLKYHPYNKEVSSDHYYVSLSEEVQQELYPINMNDSLVSVDYKYISCMLTCYFEDIVSQTGIWTSFINRNQELYGRYLPFYDTSDAYDPGQINLADIRFLIWHFCSGVETTRLVDPFSIDNEDMAIIVYDMFNQESGNAPRNEDMRTLLAVPSMSDIGQLIGHMEFLFFKSYLNFYDMSITLEDIKARLKDQRGVNKSNLDAKAYDQQLDLLFNGVTPVLAMYARELLACQAGNSHPQYESILSLSPRRKGTFLYMGADNTHLEIKHLTTNTVLRLNNTGTSLPVLTPGKSVLKMGIVSWNNDWWLTGEAEVFDYSGQVPADEKYLFLTTGSALTQLEKQEKCFLEVNGNHRLAFYDRKKKVFTLIDQVWGLFHQQYGIGTLDRKFFDVDNLEFGIDEDLEDLVVYFNPRKGLEFYQDIAKGIKTDNNPYYEQDTETDIEELLFGERYSAGFTSYILENKLIEIEPLLGESGYPYVWNNYDFLLRYYKRDSYHEDPKLMVEV